MRRRHFLTIIFMDKIIFSFHARMQMEERKISEKLVISCLKKPLKTTLQKDNRFKAVKKVNRLKKTYLVVVIFDQLDGVKEIVTVFYTSKFHKYL